MLQNFAMFMEKENPHSFFLDTKIALSQNFCTYFRQLLTQCICSDERRRHSYFQIALRVQTFHNIATFQHSLILCFREFLYSYASPAIIGSIIGSCYFCFFFSLQPFFIQQLPQICFFQYRKTNQVSLLCMQYYSR